MPLFGLRRTKPVEGTPGELQRAFFKIAREIMVEDREHSQTIFLVIGRRVQLLDFEPAPGSAEPENPKAALYAMIDVAADEAKKVDARAIIVIGEAWTAPEDEIPLGGHAWDAASREEILSASMLTRDGDAVVLSCVISRNEDGSVSLSETESDCGHEMFLLEPFYRLWGIPTPGWTMN